MRVTLRYQLNDERQLELVCLLGGYAHVYVVTTKSAVRGTNRHVLKRIAVPDSVTLKEVQKEVDIMACALLLSDKAAIETFSSVCSRDILISFSSSTHHGTSYRTGLSKCSS